MIACMCECFVSVCMSVDLVLHILNNFSVISQSCQADCLNVAGSSVLVFILLFR